MNRDELIDFLLGELPDGRAAEVERRLGSDPAWAREAELYEESLAILRAAAREETWAPAPAAAATGRAIRLRAWAAGLAAVLLVAAALFWMNRGEAADGRVFEPDVAYGALFPEELGADGRLAASLAEARADDGYHVRDGSVRSGAIGAWAQHPLRAGDPVLEESEISCGADEGALISLPHHGLLFLRPLSTVQFRGRPDGRVALRLLAGEAATVPGSAPIHLAIDGTDLLLTQEDGAALLRFQESDVLCLRGRLDLHVVDGGRWRVPVGHRLPAACAHEPESEPYRIGDLELEWYETLGGARAHRSAVELDAQGRSGPLRAGEGALLYLVASSREPVELTVRFGAGPGRTFRTGTGRPLEVRLPLSSFGSGPVLEITPATAVRELRLFEPR